MRFKYCPPSSPSSSSTGWTQFELSTATADDPNSICTITGEDATGTPLTVDASAQHDIGTGHPAIYSIPLADILESGHSIDDVAMIALRIRVVTGFGNSSQPVVYAYLTEDVTASPPNWAGVGCRWDSVSGWKLHSGGKNASTTSLGVTADDAVSTMILARDPTGTNVVVDNLIASAAAISTDARTAERQAKNSVLTSSAGWLPGDTYALCVAVGAAASTGGPKAGKVLVEYVIHEGGRT